MDNLPIIFFRDDRIDRRQFLKIGALFTAGILTGCAVNPVTGKSQLMLVSESDEIAMDNAYSPHQFSADYGVVQDKKLNAYIESTGKSLAEKTHRPNMPYRFQAVNAVYINAYAFPGGSIACTRGILLAIKNEAELAALLGHELGHVNARHTAQQMSKGQVTSTFLGGIAAIASVADPNLGSLAANLGNIGAGALLAKYSRDNEREADSLGMEYMVKSHYNPDGMVGLMDMLRKMSKSDHNLIELMFATHPMSDERFNASIQRASHKYVSYKDTPFYKDRYMDHTARLRSIKNAIVELQSGENSMAGQKYTEAETHIKKALKIAPDDYAGLIMLAKCKIAQKDYKTAKKNTDLAQEIYPKEPQAKYIIGNLDLMSKDYEKALKEFEGYESLLPGNPDITFFKGYSYEGMGRKKDAAENYYNYLQSVKRGEKAEHAYSRLVEWGYVK